MRQGPAEVLDAPDGRTPPHVFWGAGGDGARDEQLGQIFRNMRLTMKVSRETIARRLATTPSIIETFEAGAVSALPHWKETNRIVMAYCQILRMDPEPILWHLRGQLQALASQVRSAKVAPPSQYTTGRPAARSQPGPRSARSETRSPRRRRRARALFALSAPLALAVVVVYLAQMAPQPVYRVIGLMPDAMGQVVRSGLDYLVQLSAPRREGLRWIEVSDPRVRKADKLQSGAR
jgi:hypothetical protein